MNYMQTENVEASLDGFFSEARTGPGIPAERVPNGWHRRVNTPNQTLSSRSSRTVKVGLYNEGKLSIGKLHALSYQVRDQAEIAILSEGALAHNTSPPIAEGMTYIGPRKQRWGGVGFIGTENVLGGRKAKLINHDKQWSIGVLGFTRDFALIGAYITPHAATDQGTIEEMLTRIEQEVRKYKTAFIGGDWNSRTGTPSRAIIDAWATHNNLEPLTHGVSTHFPTPSHLGNDIDVAFMKGTRGYLEAVDIPDIGHARLHFEIETKQIKARDTRQRINWAKLSTHGTEFNEEVNRLLLTGQGVSTALGEAGRTILGMMSGRTNPIPHKARKRIRRERRKLRNLQRGTSDYDECIRIINEIFQKHRLKRWKQKLNSLHNQPLGQEAWKLVKALSRTGDQDSCIPDHELGEKLKTTYCSNQCHRSEWTRQDAMALRQTEGTRPHPMDSAFTASELVAAIQSLPRNKAPGNDEVPYEAFKAGKDNPLIQSAILDDFNEQLDTGVSTTSTDVKIIPIPKPNGDFRLLSLLNSERKLLEKMIYNRIEHLTCQLHPAQFGFRKGRSALHALLRIELAVQSANRDGSFLAIRTYDVAKAFDSVPKPLLATKFYDFVADHAPKLARLIYRLTIDNLHTILPSRAHITLETGTPQGGILSPLAFNLVENDLCEAIGPALVKFADDNTTLNYSEREADLNEKILETHYEYWGGKLNHDKTQQLTLNDGPITGQPIKILGAQVTAKGVTMECNSNMLTTVACWLMPLAKVNGLSPRQCFTLGRAKAWAQLSHSLPIALPAQLVLTKAWIRLCRTILHTYPATSSLSILRAVGLLFNPLWWSIETTTRFYWNALKDPYLRQLIYANEQTERELGDRVDAYLAPGGIGWNDIKESRQLPGLLHRAKLRFIAWMKIEWEREATRLEWKTREEIRLLPAKYLARPNARYGFIFLQKSLGPPERLTAPCFFCRAPGKDTGEHLIHECSSVPTRPQLLARAWRLDDSAQTSELNEALLWMRSTWKARKRIWKNEGEIVMPRGPSPPPSHFLRPQTEAPPRNARAPEPPMRRRRPHAEITTERDIFPPDPPAEPPQRRQRTSTVFETDPPQSRASTASVDETVGDRATNLTTRSGRKIRITARLMEHMQTRRRPRRSNDPPEEEMDWTERISVGQELNRADGRAEPTEHEAPRDPALPEDPPPSAEQSEMPEDNPDDGHTYSTDDSTNQLLASETRPDPSNNDEIAGSEISCSDSAEDTSTTPVQSASQPNPTTPPIHLSLNVGKWRSDEDERLLTAIREGKSGEALAAAVGTRDKRQITSRLATQAFRAKHGPNQPLVVVSETTRRKWTDEELLLLMNAINRVGNPYDYRAIYLAHPSRSIASLTAKINSLYKSNRLVVREGQYIVLPL